MAVPAPHLDPSTIDCNQIIANAGQIQEFLPHRGAMALLTAIVSLDPDEALIVGYKDVRTDEFWVDGHFPDFPIMPGVLLCEAAAQLAAFYTLSQKISAGRLMGLGGIEDTRFRRSVHPGERLVLIGKGHRIRPRFSQFNVQGYVGTELAFHTDVIGVGLARLEDL